MFHARKFLIGFLLMLYISFFVYLVSHISNNEAKPFQKLTEANKHEFSKDEDLPDEQPVR